VLAVCYALIRYAHLATFWHLARASGDEGLAATLLRFGAVATASVVAMLIGAAVGGNAQIWLWGAAVLIDLVGTQLIGASGWRLAAPRHFSERHGLIIIIAIGESIVAIGVGATDLAISAPLVIAAILGVTLSAMLWWVYFDVTAIGAEQRLAAATGAERAALARDAYTFIHLPMVAGIVLMALGLKKSLSYIGGAAGHSWHDSLHGIPQWALHVGPALYLLALVAFRYRNIRTIGETRPIAAAVLIATAPVGSHIPAMWDLVLVTAILIALVAFEATRFRETRHRVRFGNEASPPADR
jgi:low temperature requirement protein LtrA